jgi:uncharacterized membrane protein SirB2
MSPPAIPGTDAAYGTRPYPGYGYPQKPKASGMRIGAGVVAIVVAATGILLVAIRLFTKSLGSSTPLMGWMNFLLIVGVLGCLVTGIVILAKQRKRGGATPWLIASFAVLIVVACLGLNSDYNNGTPGGQAIMIPSALAATVLAALVIVLEKFRR